MGYALWSGAEVKDLKPKVALPERLGCRTVEKNHVNKTREPERLGCRTAEKDRVNKNIKKIFQMMTTDAAKMNY